MKVKIPKPELIPIEQLVRNPKNVKLHNEDQIHDLMELIKNPAIGFKDPIVLDKDNTIWAGHGRLDAAEKLGMKKVPCIYLGKMSEEAKKVFLLMDNKVNESPWNSENVKLIFDEVDPVLFEEFQMNFDDYFQKNLELSEEEWKNMPEFYQEKNDGFRMIITRFDKQEDVDAFAKALGQNITDQTKSIWFPPKPIDKITRRYVDES